MEKNDNPYSLFFLLFIFLTYFLSFLKAKRKKGKERPPPAPRPPLRTSQVPSNQSAPRQGALGQRGLRQGQTLRIKKVEERVREEPLPPRKERAEEPFQGALKPTPRIQTLVAELPSKSHLVVLAEILKPYEPIQ